jgi:hypothetical protein
VTEWYPEARAYSRDQRLKQLGEFTHLCRTIARSLRRHGEPWAADGFDDRADAAEALSHDGWDQPALTEVGANFPSGVDWLNQKAVDFNGPREPWQEDIAKIHARAAQLALDLRAAATLP